MTAWLLLLAASLYYFYSHEMAVPWLADASQSQSMSAPAPVFSVDFQNAQEANSLCKTIGKVPMMPGAGAPAAQFGHGYLECAMPPRFYRAAKSRFQHF